MSETDTENRTVERWEKALETCDAPWRATLVTGYNPSGFVSADDTPEIAGLIVHDRSGTAHHFRLYRDETVGFIECPADADAPICIDPMVDPPGDTTVYFTTGIPPAVSEVLEALDVTPRWSDACKDGVHVFETVNEDQPAYQFVRCERCGVTRCTLSWLGHSVPYENPGGGHG